ncbi:hypothetical protein BAE44_0014190 [Dichanthelium oligosanthes]|uniref:F-box domain-containing protein n=1 Tax=Dichanthelium oligosanthes TaxID=888268 RepID=A0A1E5VI55_9POAL|nr:hypothetical protein BAE44_0014190 [Dichanthelium oligosanthes]
MGVSKRKSCSKSDACGRHDVGNRNKRISRSVSRVPGSDDKDVHANAIPDDVLELILLGLDSLIHLVRAASTCKRWRSVVADAVFRRRYSSLHGPPVIAGTYQQTSYLFQLPPFGPSLSATIDGRHFSLDFLPESDSSVWKAWTAAGASSSWIGSTTMKEPVGFQIWSYASL